MHRDWHIWFFSFQLFIVLDRPILIFIFQSLKKIISFVFKIIVNFPTISGCFFTIRSFSKTVCIVESFVQKTVRSGKNDSFFKIFIEQIVSLVKNLSFFFYKILLKNRSVKKTFWKIRLFGKKRSIYQVRLIFQHLCVKSNPEELRGHKGEHVMSHTSKHL